VPQKELGGRPKGERVQMEGYGHGKGETAVSAGTGGGRRRMPLRVYSAASSARDVPWVGGPTGGEIVALLEPRDARQHASM